MKRLLFPLLALIALATAFSSCQNSVRLDLSRRIDLLIKDTSLYNHIWLDYDGISLYKSKAHKELDKPECKIYYDEIETFNGMWELYDTKEMVQFYKEKGNVLFDVELMEKVRNQLQVREEGSPEKPLAGKLIAVDPAHIGGTPQMAELEGKLLKIVKAPQDTVYIDEGALTLAVARILEVKLEKLGASVILTRRKPGNSAFEKTFFEWMREDFEREVKRDRYIKEITEETAAYLLAEASTEYIYNQYFLKKEMNRRVKIINDYSPDLALIVEFNIHEPNWKKRDAQGALRPTDKNYSLTFVPGGFMRGELHTPEQRLELLRLITTNHLDESIKLSDKVLTAFQYELGVTPVKPGNSLNYLEKSCNPTDKKGVYARNLSITRRVHAPLCYGLPLCLDNVEEFEELTKAEAQVGDDIVTSLRIEEVADAYVAALQQHFQVEAPLTEEDVVEEEI